MHSSICRKYLVEWLVTTNTAAVSTGGWIRMNGLIEWRCAPGYEHSSWQPMSLGVTWQRKASQSHSKTFPTDSQWPNRSILTWVLMQMGDQGELWVRLSWHQLDPAWGKAAEERCSEFIEDVLGRDLRQRPDRRADWVKESFEKTGMSEDYPVLSSPCSGPYFSHLPVEAAWTRWARRPLFKEHPESAARPRCEGRGY